MALIDAVGGAEGLTGERGQRIFAHPRFADWAATHGSALSRYLPGTADSMRPRGNATSRGSPAARSRRPVSL